MALNTKTRVYRSAVLITIVRYTERYNKEFVPQGQYFTDIILSITSFRIKVIRYAIRIKDKILEAAKNIRNTDF